MGVVRDVTIDQLTQAVQGISSTGISDSTGQAINNTLSTLGKDTSLQGIISSISGLGQTLGSDKANINGDNIADKATFRTNIGAINLVVLSASVEVSFQDTSTIGYRTTEQTKVAVSSLTGYPTGHTIVGMIAQATYLYGGEAFVDGSGFIRACTKASTSSLPVKVLCFYL